MSESELRAEDSLQPVKYLGKSISLQAHGIGVAVEPVRTVWKRSNKGSNYNRCAISIHPFGLCLYEEIARGTYKSVWSDAIENISYCVAEPCHRRIFAWIARSQYSNDLECHVVLCKTSKQSRLLAELLANIFYETYRYRQQKQLLGLTSNISNRCSVCDSINRQKQLNNQSLLYRNYCRLQSNNCIEEKQENDNYEHISYQMPMVARVLVGNYDKNSVNGSNSSHPSIDYDATMNDNE